MSVQTLLGDLNLDIREPAVCVTLISKWVTITGTMLKKSAMVLVDQKGTTIEGTLYEELEASNQITMDEDLYGALVGVGELQAYEDDIYGGISHKINFSLINIGFDEIKCVAYGDMAIEFYHLWNSTVSSVVLCVLNFWQIERAEGRFKHMRNIEGFSKILIEPEITEIQAFRMRIPPTPY
ncbi:BnaAnng15900D [Brassica napus]|uniref:BnaAnng15900D protein n=3 Tax=Brassica TaxID=3705 RepID=A0A078J7L8_BRANA|nr:BnaAnng15900D [Brassica napus]